MNQIGGMFYYEPGLCQENGYFSRVCPEGGDLAFTMSGRCGIYYCLEDILPRDTKKVAYVPLYTCETVLGAYEKAGYRLKFYDLDENLRSSFDPAALDEISVLALCGYYGFCNYDRSFVAACKERGIIILEDVTHSLLSGDGIDPLCDYFTGSFRKWMGVACGGFAVKCSGTFAKPLLAVDPTHLRQREQAIETASSEVFWEGELRLRTMFDSFAGDERSEYIMRHADLAAICNARRANFAAILQALPAQLHGVRPVFPVLPDAAVPSHFCFYAERREEFQEFLRQREIRSSVFWPVGPIVHPQGHRSVEYIYDHIVSVPCDQRYTPADMQRIADAAIAYSESAGQMPC